MFIYLGMETRIQCDAYDMADTSVGIDDSEALYCPIFSAHAYLLGKKEHLMIVPRFENDPIKLAEPAFRKIYLETTPLQLPDGSPMPVAHELWIRLVSNMPTQVI